MNAVAPLVRGFLDVLRELRYNEGRDFVLQAHYAEGVQDRLPDPPLFITEKPRRKTNIGGFGPFGTRTYDEAWEPGVAARWWALEQ
jgi:hypothetical protein